MKTADKFVQVCKWLSNSEFDATVTDRRYNAVFAKMRDLRNRLSMAEVSALYFAKAIHPRFV